MYKLEKVKREILKYDYIRFAVCDLNGVSRGQIVPRRHAAKYLETGVDMYQGLLMFGSDIEVILSQHEKEFHYGNMNIFPDLDTLRSVPWGGDEKLKVGEILCESRWKRDNSPQEACPRYVARQQIKRLNDLGFRLFSGFEMEYFLFHADTLKPIFEAKFYMDHKNQNKHGRMLFDFDQLLMESGVDVERQHLEHAPSMFEAVMKPTYDMECPDSAFNLKQGLKEIADMKDLKASFISKHDFNERGAGTHFSFSLLSKETGDNVFYDDKASDKLSSTAKHWIAGILKHAKALTALMSPTTNCYRRLHEHFAPSAITWGIEDREALLRVKNHGPSGTYLENRLPSGLSNPYLVVAATIAAGLDGVANKMKCPPQGTLKDLDTLPQSFPGATEALKEDTVLRNALGDELVTWFLKCKDVDLKKFGNLSEEEMISLERKLFL